MFPCHVPTCIMSAFLSLAQKLEPTVGALPQSSDPLSHLSDKCLLWSNAPCPQSLPAPEMLSVTRELDIGVGRLLECWGYNLKENLHQKLARSDKRTISFKLLVKKLLRTKQVSLVLASVLIRTLSVLPKVPAQPTNSTLLHTTT